MPSTTKYLELPYSIEYDYQRAERAVLDPDSPLCGPGCDEDVSVNAVYIGNTDVLPHLSVDLIRDIEQQCLEEEHKKREARDAND
jgi:hypothetical protein